MLDWGGEMSGELDPVQLAQREWLVTNGIGGYAAGTVAGILTRRYHGLLIAALKPPAGRALLLTKLDEVAIYHSAHYPLFANQWADDLIEPAGYRHLQRFRLEGTTPVWHYAVDDARLEKRVWMQPGANTTYIRYDLLQASAPLRLAIKIIANGRDHHANTQASEHFFTVKTLAQGVQIDAPQIQASYTVQCQGAKFGPQVGWYHNYYLPMEAYRGLPARDDNLFAGVFEATLVQGDSLTIVTSTEADPNLDGIRAYQTRLSHEQALLARMPRDDATPAIKQLVLAADQFIIRRSIPGSPDGASVIAGYPWFGDWGRDTMISLPGLTLATGRPEVARQILCTYARFVDRGMVPNRFPDQGQRPEYNTVDATLWYLEAIRAYHAATGDDALLEELFPVLKEIIGWHRRGTRFGICWDETDGLLWAGEPGLQLTWMDAKVDDWVVTPRMGKAVEINALWYNALCILAGIAERLGRPEPTAQIRDMAEQTRASFGRFWNSPAGYCFDVIEGPDGDDRALRPNQLLAVSLPHSPLPAAQQQAVVDACTRHLLTPHGLRSLAPDHSGYIGRYGGDRYQRDAAYHQGTVWGWLIGPFATAHLRVYQDPEMVRDLLNPLLGQLASHGVGTISEIFDGDPPYIPRGCFAQAWSVAELLRVWYLTAEAV